MPDYRTRCYEAFISKHWKYIHTLSREEYEFHRKLYAPKYRRHLPKDKNTPILDVACGAGHFLYFLKQEGYQAISGIDISAEQTEMAGKMGIAGVEKADLFEYLPRHRGQYELIIANDIIEHLKKDEVLGLLDNIFLALKPGGRVLLGTENAGSLLGASRVFLDFTHEQGFTPTSLMQVLRVCGFEEAAVYGDGPVVHDFQSLIRSALWKGLSALLKIYLLIECGAGRLVKKQKVIVEPRLFAIAKKPRKPNGV